MTDFVYFVKFYAIIYCEFNNYPQTACFMPAKNDITSQSLNGKVALVTGAGRGIGRKCAEMLADAGATVLAVARGDKEIGALAGTRPDRIQALQFDVTSDLFIDHITRLKQLDILVNNAGINRPQPFAAVDDATLRAMIELNIHAAFRTAQAAARIMLNSGCQGSIINMSSQMGHVGAPERTVYCMTKHAIEGLTKAMAVELAPRGIRVNSVAPTFIETPLTQPMLAQPQFNQSVLARIPLGRIGQVEDVAHAVLFLASPAATMITGDSLKVDGGWTAQ